MNTNENEVVMSGDEELRAKLCAVLLGEASDEVRAEVEAALANSAELRAERARIEATIGLVAGALKETGAGELSPQASAALQAAASKRATPKAFYRTTGFRIAASFAVVAVGAFAMRSIVVPQSETLGELASAKSDSSPDANPEASKGSYGEVAKDERARRLDDVASAPIVEGEARKNTPENTAVALNEEAAPAEAGQSAPVETKLNFDQAPANQPATGGVTGNDLVVIDGVESLGTRFDPAQADALIAQLREQQKGIRPAHSTYLHVEQQIAQLEAARDAADAGIFNPDPEWLAKVAAATPPAGATGGTPIGIGAVSTGGTGGAALGQVPARESVPTESEAASQYGGGGGPSAFSARRAGSANKGATNVSSGRPGAGGPSSPGPTTAGGSPPAPGVPASGYFHDAGEKHASKEELDELKKLGYATDADEEVTGRAFDDDKDDRFKTWKEGELTARFDFGPDNWRYRYDEFRRVCLPRRNERPRDMFFRFWGDNPFELTALDALSTFAADVDSASYTLARKYLVDGNLPTKEQIRTEEFVNYFKGDVAPPTEGVFRIATELAPSMFGNTNSVGDSPDTWMLRVAIRGREVAKNERQPLALTFVIDVSGSMKEENRLELVKHALRQLVNQLDARDSIALIKFSTDAALILPMTAASQRTLIESAIDPLQPDGSTNTEAGLRMGYAQAVASLTQNATNRVVLLTDGVANVGLTDPNALTAMVELQRKAGIYLNTVGVGMDNHNDHLLEQLANKGDGVCNYVDDAKEVKRALVDNFTGALETIARDVKIQVEFDPAQVERYRLLGYENRAVADVDFRNDKIDAGEIGAGHQVVALYEIVRKQGGDAALATVRLRYKQPFKAGVAGGNSDESTELAQQVDPKSAAGSFAATTAGYRRSVLVAQFAEFLRRSIHARYDSLDRLIEESKRLDVEMKDSEFSEFVAALVRSREIVLRELDARRAPIERCYDELRHRAYLLQQIDQLERRFADKSQAEELDRAARDLERQLDQLRTKLEALHGQIDEPTLAQIQAENIVLQRRLLELLEKLKVDGRLQKLGYTNR